MLDVFAVLSFQVSLAVGQQRQEHQAGHSGIGVGTRAFPIMASDLPFDPCRPATGVPPTVLLLLCGQPGQRSFDSCGGFGTATQPDRHLASLRDAAQPIRFWQGLAVAQPSRHGRYRLLQQQGCWRVNLPRQLAAAGQGDQIRRLYRAVLRERTCRAGTVHARRATVLRLRHLILRRRQRVGHFRLEIHIRQLLHA